jgi:hypothetical protein
MGSGPLCIWAGTATITEASGIKDLESQYVDLPCDCDENGFYFIEKDSS